MQGAGQGTGGVRDRGAGSDSWCRLERVAVGVQGLRITGTGVKVRMHAALHGQILWRRVHPGG